jgi:hypothetical protein
LDAVFQEWTIKLQKSIDGNDGNDEYVEWCLNWNVQFFFLNGISWDTAIWLNTLYHWNPSDPHLLDILQSIKNNRAKCTRNIWSTATNQMILVCHVSFCKTRIYWKKTVLWFRRECLLESRAIFRIPIIWCSAVISTATFAISPEISMKTGRYSWPNFDFRWAFHSVIQPCNENLNISRLCPI